MAEKQKTGANKDKNKILLVIGILVIAAAILIVISFSKSQTIPQNVSDNATLTQAPSEFGSRLTSQKWTWVNTQMNDGSQFLPSTEGAFTLTFQDDLRVIATTDCNGGNGSYVLGEDNSITFGPMATTMMFCEDSSETQFFQDLNNIGSYMIDANGNLVLMIKFDSGSMIFE